MLQVRGADLHFSEPPCHCCHGYKSTARERRQQTQEQSNRELSDMMLHKRVNILVLLLRGIILLYLVRIRQSEVRRYTFFLLGFRQLLLSL